MPTSQITSTTGSAKTLGQLTVTGPIPLSLSLYDKSAKMLSLWKIVIPQTTPTSSERVWCRAYQRQCYCHSSKNHFPLPIPTKMMISSFSPPVFGLSSKLCQNRTAGPLTGSIPILGGSSADKLSGPPPARKVSSCTSRCGGSSKRYSSGARTKRNSSDDP